MEGIPMKSKLALVLLFTLIAVSAYAANSAVVAYTFVCNGKTSGPCPNGASPNSLIQASDGNFYGTAASSGSKAGGQTLFGGTIFSLTPAGKFTLLHTFTPGTSKNFASGSTPVSLTEGPDGKLYGLTVNGGINFAGQFYGYGVLFRLSKTGSGFQVIHKFCSVQLYICTDGAYPSGPLVVGTDGNIYGATTAGGSGYNGSNCPSGGCGTTFRVTPSSGAYKVVFSFGGTVTNGGFPSALTPASDGTFYGLGAGGMFQYSPSTGTIQTMTLPFPFPAGCPGLACFAGSTLTFGPNGNLYSFYTVYDAAGDSGIYEVQTNASNFQLLPLFTSVTGGATELLLASDGNFWAPRIQGSSTHGDILTLSPSSGAAIQVLTPFGTTVSNPAEIIEATDGTLWGVAGGSGTVSGTGHFSGGTVFSLNAGLPPR
jgi:hypothetical protein